MIDTPKARALGLPWKETVSDIGTEWIGYSTGQTMFYTTNIYTSSETSPRRRDNRRAVLTAVNLIGPHIDDPDRMSALRAVSAMDDETFAVFLDWMRERGFVEM